MYYIMHKNFRHLCPETVMRWSIIIFLGLYSVEAYSWDPLGDITHPDRILRNVQRELDNATKAVTDVSTSTAPASEVERALRNKIDASDKAAAELERLVRETDEGRKQLIFQKEELLKVQAQLQADKDKLAAEKEALRAEKVILENKKDLYATGLYSSLIAGALALSTVLMRLSTIRLEREYLKAQISEKSTANGNMRRPLPKRLPKKLGRLG